MDYEHKLECWLPLKLYICLVMWQRFLCMQAILGSSTLQHCWHRSNPMVFFQQLELGLFAEHVGLLWCDPP